VPVVPLHTQNVQYERSGLDDFAEAAARAAGDDVELDLAEKLLVALKKRDRINGNTSSRSVSPGCGGLKIRVMIASVIVLVVH
jgi:hypothetical protein